MKNIGFVFVRKGLFSFFIKRVVFCFLGVLFFLVGRDEREKCLVLDIDVFVIILRFWERIINFLESDLFIRDCFLIKRCY